VLGRRTGIHHPQFVCLDCHSFFHRSGYKETEIQQKKDFEFLLSHRDHHTAILGQLCLEIITRVPGAKTYCEVGYGAGILMKSFQNFGLKTYGFEVNPYCYEFASKELGLACELGIFDESHSETYDIIASCMVFEHLEQPRKIFEIMKSKLNRDGAIYLSVPFIHRSDWRYLWSADTDPGPAPPDIFYDNDVHITHFSVEGMKRMGLGLGARDAQYWVSQDIWDKSPGSYHGILFQF